MKLQLEQSEVEGKLQFQHVTSVLVSLLDNHNKNQMRIHAAYC